MLPENKVSHTYIEPRFAGDQTAGKSVFQLRGDV